MTNRSIPPSCQRRRKDDESLNSIEFSEEWEGKDIMGLKYFTSESVTEGHPDKICDQISDAVLDALISEDPMSRVACETACTTGLVLVMGEITTNCYADIPKIVRKTINDIGYNNSGLGFCGDTCAVVTTIDEQSADIALGVDRALEVRDDEYFGSASGSARNESLDCGATKDNARNESLDCGATKDSARNESLSCGATKDNARNESLDCVAQGGVQNKNSKSGSGAASIKNCGDPASDSALDLIGAGDQGMMFGFACNETPELMPMPIQLAHNICKNLAALRKTGEVDYLRPDGKAQVTVAYEGERPVHIDAVVLSTQHAPHVSQKTIEQDMLKLAILPAIPPELLNKNTKYFINPTGRFVIGGPQGDSGLTGRKIIVDTYGGFARHGGGAFSGKDPTKVDRAAAYAARYVAKNIVAAGLADKCELQLAYAIGVACPVSIYIKIDTFGTGALDEDRLVELVRENFDLRPAAIIRDLDLRRPIYRQIAAYGHFGRSDLDLPWEKTDKAELLRKKSSHNC